MSLWNRLGNIVKSNTSSHSEPSYEEALVQFNSVIELMTEQLRELQREVVKTQSDLVSLKERIQTIESLVEGLHLQAESFVQQNQIDKAKATLQKAAMEKDRLERMREEWSRMRACQEPFAGQLQQLEQEVNQFKQKRDEWVRRGQTATIATEIYDTIHQMNSRGQVLTSFEKFQDQVFKQEAMAELKQSRTLDSLNEEIEKLKKRNLD